MQGKNWQAYCCMPKMIDGAGAKICRKGMGLGLCEQTRGDQPGIPRSRTGVFSSALQTAPTTTQETMASGMPAA